MSSAIFGIISLYFIDRLSPELAILLDGRVRGAVFVVGVSACGVALVLDHAVAGLMCSSIQLTRNLTASIVKCVLLGGAIVFGVGGSFTIVLASVFGVTISILFGLVLCSRKKNAVFSMPDFYCLKGFGGAILGHHSLNVATQAVGLLLPLIVTSLVSARANGAFFTAWMIVQVFCLGPAALTTMLYPIATKEASRLPTMMRLTLFLSLCIGVMGEVLLIGLGQILLSLFSHELAIEGYALLLVLGMGIFPAALRYHFVALRRIQGRAGDASLILGVAALFDIGCAVMGAYLGAALGLSLGWLLSLIVQAVIIWPILHRAIRIDGVPPTNEVGSENLNSCP